MLQIVSKDILKLYRKKNQIFNLKIQKCYGVGISRMSIVLQRLWIIQLDKTSTHIKFESKSHKTRVCVCVGVCFNKNNQLMDQLFKAHPHESLSWGVVPSYLLIHFLLTTKSWPPKLPRRSYTVKSSQPHHSPVLFEIWVVDIWGRSGEKPMVGLTVERLISKGQ